MAFICLQTIPDGVNSCSGYIYTGRETAISVLRSGRGRRRAGLGRCAVGDGLPEWCVGCADAAGGGDADDEAGADGFGVVVDLVDDVDTAFEASCGWDGGGALTRMSLAMRLSSLSFLSKVETRRMISV